MSEVTLRLKPGIAPGSLSLLFIAALLQTATAAGALFGTGGRHDLPAGQRELELCKANQADGHYTTMHESRAHACAMAPTCYATVNQARAYTHDAFIDSCVTTALPIDHDAIGGCDKMALTDRHDTMAHQTCTRVVEGDDAKAHETNACATAASTSTTAHDARARSINTAYGQLDARLSTCSD